MILRDLDEATYHGDPDSLSQSGAKLLLRSPALYRWRLDNPQPPSDTFDFGHVAHRLILGAGADVEVVEHDSWRTKAAKEAQEAARAAGKVPVLTGDFERAKALADAVHSHPVAGRLFSDGEAEVSAYYDEPETGVRMRARFDWLRANAIVDLKTAADASPSGFAKSAANYGYGMQARWYQRVLDANGGGWVPFVFVAVEKEPPHQVGIYTIGALDDPAVTTEWEAIGDADVDRALRLYAHCRDTDTWPGYPDRITTLEPPRWLTYNAAAQEAAS